MSSKIYKITNLINNKIYVGYTKKSLEKRFEQHCSLKNLKINKMPIKQAIQKYGKENFKIELLEESEDDNYIHNVREAYWIEKLEARDLNKGYNIAKGGDGGDTFSNNPNKEYICELRSKTLLGAKIYYDPETFKARRILKNEQPPKGWIHGMPPQWRLNVNNKQNIPPTNKGVKWSKEKRKEISEKTKAAMDNLPRKECPYCKKIIIKSNYNKHVCRCKSNPNHHDPKIYIMKITNTFTNRILVDWHIDYSDGIDDSFGSDSYMKEALTVYDKSLFKKEILEYCTKENKEERKRFWIKKLHSDEFKIGFNKKED